MQIRGHDIGVCGWSLHPKDTAELIAALRQIGIEHVQLATAPLMEMSAEQRAAEIQQVRDAGLKITAMMINFPGEDYTTIQSIRRTGGFLPDDRWEERREIALRAGKVTAEIGAPFLTSHFGFIPPSSDPLYKVIVERAREIANGLHEDGVELLMETGQESASELLQFLNDTNCRNVGVNFDPGNMIIYGAGDPVEAVHTLNRHVRHVHVKDGVSSSQPRVQWGREVSFGTGEVPPRALLDALDDVEYDGPLVIERETPGGTGNDRVLAIRSAVRVLQDAERTGVEARP